MKKNLSQIDRGLRAVVGLLVLWLGYYSQSYWGLIGLMLLATSAISFCPLYCVFKFSTKAKGSSPERDVIS